MEIGAPLVCRDRNGDWLVSGMASDASRLVVTRFGGLYG